MDAAEFNRLVDTILLQKACGAGAVDLELVSKAVPRPDTLYACPGCRVKHRTRPYAVVSRSPGLLDHEVAHLIGAGTVQKAARPQPSIADAIAALERGEINVDQWWATLGYRRR